MEVSLPFFERDIETVPLLLDLGASVSVEDGATVDLIVPMPKPSKSTGLILHIGAAYGGNARCCQHLISKGATLTAETVNRDWSLLIVSLNRNRLVSNAYDQLLGLPEEKERVLEKYKNLFLRIRKLEEKQQPQFSQENQ